MSEPLKEPTKPMLVVAVLRWVTRRIVTWWRGWHGLVSLDSPSYQAGIHHLVELHNFVEKSGGLSHRHQNILKSRIERALGAFSTGERLASPAQFEKRRQQIRQEKLQKK